MSRDVRRQQSPCARLRPRARARAGRAGARPREPDRRAHRLQRRARAALRDRPRHRRASRRAATTRCLRVHSTTLGATRRDRRRAPSPAAGGWLDYVAGVVAAFAQRGPRRCRGSTSRSRATCRASRASRARRRSRSRSRRCSTRPAASSSTAPRARGSRIAPRTSSSASRAGAWISSRARSASAIAALRIDCRDFSVRAVPLPGERLRVLIVDSGVRRQLADGDYGRRRAECEAALARARAAGIAPRRRARRWRDVDPARPRRARARARRRCCFAARATCSPRTRAWTPSARRSSAAISRASARCCATGMASLRDDFEVSRPELDALCEIGDAHPGCLRLAPHGRRLRRLHDPSRRAGACGRRRRRDSQRLRAALRPRAGRAVVQRRRRGSA